MKTQDPFPANLAALLNKCADKMTEAHNQVKSPDLDIVLLGLAAECRAAAGLIRPVDEQAVAVKAATKPEQCCSAAPKAKKPAPAPAPVKKAKKKK